MLGLFRAYMGVMEKQMETLGSFKGIYRGCIGVF